MPNYVANVLKIKNIKSIPELIDDNGDVVMNFDKIIPMPKSLDPKLVPEDSEKDSAIIYYLTDRCTIPIHMLSDDKQLLIANHVTNMFSRNWSKTVFSRAYETAIRNNHTHRPMQNDKMYELGKRYVDNLNEYGVSTWYDWCIENWGTKWNAGESRQINQDSLYFETAWSAPEPAICALSVLHPDVEIKITWADEDAGNDTGYAIYSNGICIRYINYDSQSKDAIEMYKNCWNCKEES